MSLNITAAASAATSLPVVRRTAPTRPTQAGGSDAVIVDLNESNSTPEAHGTSAIAGQTNVQPAASGPHLRFNVDDRTGKVKVGVYDLRGNVLFTVPSSTGLEIADGGTS